MSTEEVRHGAMMRNFPRLARAFTDLGLSVVAGKCAAMGDDERMRAALAVALPRGNGERLLHIINCLSCALCQPPTSNHAIAPATVLLLLQAHRRRRVQHRSR